MGYFDEELKQFLELFPVVKEVAGLAPLNDDDLKRSEEEKKVLFKERLRVLVLVYQVVKELRRFL